MRWPWKRTKSAEMRLVETIVEGELRRRELDAQTETKRAELEARKIELEMQNLERIGEEKRKDAIEKERIRQMRKEYASRGAQRREANREARKNVCPVCADPTNPGLTPSDIQYHIDGHPGALANVQ